jgi:uncharacterized protein YgfB (UPF0149 family)
VRRALLDGAVQDAGLGQRNTAGRRLGFLYGLGTGQISDLEALNGDVGEIVRDFTEISRASGEAAEADESNEQAYAELVEFIRVAAQVVFEELLPLRQQAYPTVPQRLH